MFLRQSMLAGNASNGTNGTAEEEGEGGAEVDVNDFRHMSECMQVSSANRARMRLCDAQL